MRCGRLFPLGAGTSAKGLDIGRSADLVRERGADNNVLPAHHARELAFDAGRQDVCSGCLVACLRSDRVEADQNDGYERIHLRWGPARGYGSQRVKSLSEIEKA
jgi:hypothetical protein